MKINTRQKQTASFAAFTLVTVLALIIIMYGACNSNEQKLEESVVEERPVAGGTQLVSEAEVGLPVYPGLELASKAEAQTLEDGTETLPVIIGKTYDPMDKVVAFYEEKLTGWNSGEFHGMRYFWKGDPDDTFSPVSREMMSIPSVMINPPLQEGDWIRVQYIYEK